MGRPKIIIDWEQLEKLCQIQCTLEEVAGWFQCSEDAIQSAIQEKHNETFTVFFKKHSSKGKVSLRRWQFRMAEYSPVMAIWLGKQYLGQVDKQECTNVIPEGFDIGIINQGQAVNGIQPKNMQKCIKI